MHLVDLLVALSLLAVVLAATLGAFGAGQRTYTQGAARVETQQTARLALERMSREIRQAGAGGGTLLPIAVAEPARVVLQHDADGDGRAAARGETITWQLTSGVLRRNAGAGAQPIVNGVRALSFTYLDAGGSPTTAPAAVYRVVISLTTEPEHPGAGGATLTKLTTEVRLRNR